MTGQQLYQEIQTQFQREGPVHIRALQGHSGGNLDFSTLSHKKMEKECASLLCHIGFSRHEVLQNPADLCHEDLDRKAVYVSLVSSLDPNPDPKHKPQLHKKNHHDDCL